MKSGLKIWHIILTLCLFILVIRIDLVYNSYLLLLKYISTIFTNPNFAISQLNLDLIDPFVSAILIVAIPVFVLLRKQKIKYFQHKIRFAESFVILISFTFVFAPLITNFNPDFQKDIGVTKLLPPLSSVKQISLKKNETQPDKFESFLVLKNLVIKNSFNNKIIFIDSLKKSINDVIYYQNGMANKVSKNKLILSGGEPEVKSKIFLLGTDELGRDIFSRLVYGARISLFVGFCSVAVSLILGLSLGFLAGYPGGIIDTFFNRFTDMFLAFPIIFLIILILALFGNSIFTVILVLGFSGWMSLFKIVRTEVISIKNKDYFVSAELIGLPKSKLLINEILPVILVPVVVNLVFQYGNVILAEAALSFLGLGTGSAYPSWGAMIESGQNYLTQAWWMIFFPGIILFFTLFAANSIGRQINIHLNPRLKG